MTKATSPRVHPAETGGLLGTIAIAVAHGPFHINDPTTIAYIGGAAGGVPAAITFLVNHGGLLGALKEVFTGKPPNSPRSHKKADAA